MALLTPASSDWTVVFRFGDGGRNLAGRPGRTVIVAIFVRTSEARQMNLTGLFRCREVEHLIAEAYLKCPTPKPDRVEFGFDTIPAKIDPAVVAQVISEREIGFAGDDSLDRAAAIMGHLPEEQSWAMKVGRREGTNDDFAEIRQVAPLPRPPRIPPSSRSSHPPPVPGKNNAANRHLRIALRALRAIPRGCPRRGEGRWTYR